jgi:hypothetical protein
MLDRNNKQTLEDIAKPAQRGVGIGTKVIAIALGILGVGYVAHNTYHVAKTVTKHIDKTYLQDTDTATYKTGEKNEPTR